MMAYPWTPQEDQVLFSMETVTADEVARLLPGRTLRAARQRRQRIMAGTADCLPFNVVPEGEELLEIERMALSGRPLHKIQSAYRYHPMVIRHIVQETGRRGKRMLHYDVMPRQIAPMELPPDAFKDYRLSTDVRMSAVVPDRVSGCGSSLA